eukprot:1185379-Prorocentrum_minimum.AAC.2
MTPAAVRGQTARLTLTSRSSVETIARRRPRGPRNAGYMPPPLTPLVRSAGGGDLAEVKRLVVAAGGDHRLLGVEGHLVHAALVPGKLVQDPPREGVPDVHVTARAARGHLYAAPAVQVKKRTSERRASGGSSSVSARRS